MVLRRSLRHRWHGAVERPDRPKVELSFARQIAGCAVQGSTQRCCPTRCFDQPKDPHRAHQMRRGPEADHGRNAFGWLIGHRERRPTAALLAQRPISNRACLPGRSSEASSHHQPTRTGQPGTHAAPVSHGSSPTRRLSCASSPPSCPRPPKIGRPGKSTSAWPPPTHPRLEVEVASN